MGKTITEKIFAAHRRDNPTPENVILDLDVVMCHEITTPIAVTDLEARGMDRVFDPDKIKVVIDHVTPSKDSKTATQAKILRDWARRHKIRDFFDVGRNGVCHALFPEKGFIRPGYTVIMGDSHTCTHGAFGAFAAGVGTTDLEVGILKGVCSFRLPKTIKITITGTLPKGVYAKDVILYIIKQLTVNGATDAIMEFVGPVVDAMSMESRMTLCNMAIEAGATCGVCLPDRVTAEYLWPFIKDEYTSLEAAVNDFAQWHSDPDAAYWKELTYDVSGLVPQVTYGFKPDEVKDVTEMEGRPVDQVYLGSCTNGRIEDMEVAASMLKGRKVHPEIRVIIFPGTQQIYLEALRRGYIETFVEAGAVVSTPTCGPCLGGHMGILAKGEKALATTNRNFVGRMGHPESEVYLCNPAVAAASAIKGKITAPWEI